MVPGARFVGGAEGKGRRTEGGCGLREGGYNNDHNNNNNNNDDDDDDDEGRRITS